MTPTTASVGAAESARRRLLDGITVVDRTTAVGGVSTAYLEAGDGPPLVLLHGPGEFKERWFRVIPGLARHHRVVAPDFPGHGRSERPPDDFDAAGLLAWVDALLDECSDERPVLVGHILGGSVAARYAAGHSDRLARLVLIDSLGLSKFRPSPRFALGLLGFMLRPTPRSHQRFMRQCLADVTTVEEATGDKWTALREYTLDRAKDPDVKATMKLFMSTVGVPPIPATELAAITTPTSLIWGQADKANRVRVAEAASERFGWPLEVIAGSADDPPMERPDELVAAVLRTSVASDNA